QPVLRCDGHRRARAPRPEARRHRSFARHRVHRRVARGRAFPLRASPRIERARAAPTSALAHHAVDALRMRETPIPSTRTRSREELADYLLDIGATLAS